jgi:hypothetical protein
MSTSLTAAVAVDMLKTMPMVTAMTHERTLFSRVNHCRCVPPLRIIRPKSFSIVARQLWYMQLCRVRSIENTGCSECYVCQSPLIIRDCCTTAVPAHHSSCDYGTASVVYSDSTLRFCDTLSDLSMAFCVLQCSDSSSKCLPQRACVSLCMRYTGRSPGCTCTALW